MELAIQNLIEKALPPKVNVYQGRDCNWVITSDESTLNSSIILVDDVMNFMQKEAGVNWLSLCLRETCFCAIDPILKLN